MIGKKKKWEVGSREYGQEGEEDLNANILVIQRLEEQSSAVCWGGL